MLYIYLKILKTMKTKHTSLFNDIPWKSLSMSCIACMFLDWNIKRLVKTNLITPWWTSMYQLKTDKWPWIREKVNQVVYEDLWYKCTEMSIHANFPDLVRIFPILCTAKHHSQLGFQRSPEIPSENTSRFMTLTPISNSIFEFSQS